MQKLRGTGPQFEGVSNVIEGPWNDYRRTLALQRHIDYLQRVTKPKVDVNKLLRPTYK